MLNNEERSGNWIQTFKGNQFWPVDPRPEEIDIDDIAHSLSHLCRYAGHCLTFYSVAEHSVILSEYVSNENKLWALLHDASEAYLVDIPRPVKPLIPQYVTIENKLQQVIAQKYNLPLEIPKEVIDADYRILQDERQQNMAKSVVEWNMAGKEPIGVKLKFWTPQQAEAKFLMRFRELTQ